MLAPPSLCLERLLLDNLALSPLQTDPVLEDGMSPALPLEDLKGLLRDVRELLFLLVHQDVHPDYLVKWGDTQPLDLI